MLKNIAKKLMIILYFIQGTIFLIYTNEGLKAVSVSIAIIGLIVFLISVRAKANTLSKILLVAANFMFLIMNLFMIVTYKPPFVQIPWMPFVICILVFVVLSLNICLDIINLIKEK